MKSFLKKLNSFYSKRYWYINTYNSLGSEWLKQSIESKDVNVQKGYMLVNLSANAGYYERDVCLMHEEKNPYYIVGDIFASSLKDKKVENSARLKYLEGNTDAYCVDVSQWSNQVDVIVDCKGALWYALSNIEISRNKLTELLRRYETMLKNGNGVLIIDCYEIHIIKHILNCVVWRFKGVNNKNCILKSFGELSTYSYMKQFFGKELKTLCNKLDINPKIPNKPLSQYMRTAIINKKDLNILISKVSAMSELQFLFVKLKYKMQKCLCFFILTMFALCILFGLIYIIFAIIIR